LSPPLDLPPLAAVLVNPGVALATRDVFAKFAGSHDQNAIGDVPRDRDALIAFLDRHGNDLAPPAIACAAIIAEVIDSLRAVQGCLLARMSGSGATCFGLFGSAGEAAAAGWLLQAGHKDWWVYPTTIGAQELRP
jgi:4-diphosphocytidyl-2-C-methyl-D-erythritol kinase